MAKNLPTTPKLEKVYKQLPNLYLGTKFKDQSVLRALLLAFCQEDDELTKQIQNAKAQLFVKTAGKQFLDIHALNNGIDFGSDVNLSENVLRDIIPHLSYKPKTVKKSIYDLIEVFYGKKFTHTTVDISPRIGSLNFEERDTLIVQIDDLDKQTIILPKKYLDKDGNGVAVTLETLQEVFSLVKGAGAAIKDRELLVYSKSYGLDSKIKILGGSILDKILINGSEFINPISFNFNDKPNAIIIRNSGYREITIDIPGFINVTETDKAFFITDYSTEDKDNNKQFFQLYDFVTEGAKKDDFPSPPDTGYMYTRDKKGKYMLSTPFSLIGGEVLSGDKTIIRIDNNGLDSQFKNAITDVVISVSEKTPKNQKGVIDRKNGVSTALAINWTTDMDSEVTIPVSRVSDYYIQLKDVHNFNANVYSGLGKDKELQIRYIYDISLLNNVETANSGMYVTSSTADRRFVEEILQKVIASGVILKFNVNLERLPHGITGVYSS